MRRLESTFAVQRSRRWVGLFLKAFFAVAIVGGAISGGAAVIEADEPNVENDVRFGNLKDLNGYFPFSPPRTSDEWKTRAEAVRRQVLVSQGLWPLPTKTPLNAVVHGRVDRDDHTVERVYFESVPGFFVTGSLYRPKGFEGPRPVVLCPHGHFANGRFYDAGASAAKAQIEAGAEQFPHAARFPLQARCTQLARLGCIVLFYDMIGYADSQQIPFEVSHKYAEKRPQMEGSDTWGLFSPQAESRLQQLMGLQTWNSIRALDFVETLPDVDRTRIGVTGASGGGTQTFLLGACDERPTVIMPAVMVSTAMQGGCTCENASLLRVGTGNVELAGLFAPKPLGLLAADDWTKEIMTKGFPELRELYRLLGAPKNVAAFPFTQFPHNYNSVSRAAMYHFFNEHLKLGAATPIVEESFEPLTKDELTVWTGEHKPPEAGEEFERKLTRTLADDSDTQMAALLPHDRASGKKYREVVGSAIDVILGRRLEDVGSVNQHNLEKVDRGDSWYFRCLLTVQDHDEVVPVTYYHPKSWNNEVVVWLADEGAASVQRNDGSPKKFIGDALGKGYAVAVPDLLGIGTHTADDFPKDRNRSVASPRPFAGYTYGYNHPLFAQRVHDVLTVVAHAQRHEGTEAIHLAGTGELGVVAVAAAVQCGDAVDRLLVDTHGFRFADLTDYLDASFLPGIVKYGDLPALVALRAPQPTWAAGENPLPEVALAAYRALDAHDRLLGPDGERPKQAGLAWLFR